MILTSKRKSCIRWGCIIVTSLLYIGTLLVNILDFGLTKKYQDILFEKTITIKACNAVVDSFEQYYEQLINISFFGYIVAITLTLLIFKKVR